MRVSRRQFLAGSAAAGTGLLLYQFVGGAKVALATVPGATMSPSDIPMFATPLLVPPVMPRAGTIRRPGGKLIDYYEISVRQIDQQVLPAGLPTTTVWGYGSVNGSGSRNPLLFHHAPSLTIEASWRRPVRVKWINDLVNAAGRYLPHLLPVDPTLHWANPAGGALHRDSRPTFTTTPGPYEGPVPLVTHVHGAVAVGDESDGYPEAWYLPAAKDIPDGYASNGSWYDFFSGKASAAFGATWGPGYAVFQYPNENRASTIWYHDHTLGMTRLNVYAGPAGFYLVRGGPDGDRAVTDRRTRAAAVLPGPAPMDGDRFPSNKTYYEIPVAIQDRAFNADGSLFYPDTRTYFDGIIGPTVPDEDELDEEPSPAFPPIWNPEFFGNAIVVNGSTWPVHEVERRRYRFRFLNGCQSRFLILDFGSIPGIDVWQIGNEGGFLAEPHHVTGAGNRLLLGLAERADVIVDFAGVPLGRHVLENVGPDEPFGGGEPGEDFTPADPESTGLIMAFDVVPATGADPTTPPGFLVLPPVTPLPVEQRTRPLALIEMSAVGHDAAGEPVEGPVEALLGTVGPDTIDPWVPEGMWTARTWSAPVTENPEVGATELWEFYNTTADAHPMHVHEVAFEVVNRERLVLDDLSGEVLAPATPNGEITGPEAWETGVKDTVIAYPGQVTRVRLRFGTPGQFVWHCHIVEHEDNEMMRPFRIGPTVAGQPD